jgi:hypothetical protein
MTARPRIELHIDALVLDGIAPSPGLAAAIEAELQRLFTEAGAMEGLLPPGQGHSMPRREIARLDGAIQDGGPGLLPLGARVGRALYQTLQGLGSPRHSASASGERPTGPKEYRP